MVIRMDEEKLQIIKKKINGILKVIITATENIDESLTNLEKVYGEFSEQDQRDIIKSIAEFLDRLENLAYQRKMSLYYYLKKDQGKKQFVV